MTAKEKKDAIEKLQELNKAGVITDQELVDKIVNLEKPNEDSSNSQGQGKPGAGGILAALFLTVCLIALFGIITNQKPVGANSSASTNVTHTYSKDTSQTASLRNNANETDNLIITIAQEFVKKELKDPSSAKFPWGDSNYTISKLKGNWVVKGYVDAKNSFGATVRSKFESCFTLEWVNGKDHSTKVYTLIYE